MSAFLQSERYDSLVRLYGAENVIKLDGHNPFRRALSYQAYMAHNHYSMQPLPIDKLPCPPDFGTPPSAFFDMRMSLRAHFENSVREEILQEEV